MIKGLTQIYVFIGPPGAGKGSLSNLCTQELGWLQLSTGNVCRQHIAEQTELGKQIDFAIKSGKLVSDELVAGVVSDWLLQHVGKVPAIILDGYPRTLVQAQALDAFVKNANSSLKLNIVKLHIADEIIQERLASRCICVNSSCQMVYSLLPDSTQKPKQTMLCDRCGQQLIRRKDDEKEAISERLKIYHKHAQDLLNYYVNAQHAIAECNVDMPLDAVFKEFKKRVGLITS